MTAEEENRQRIGAAIQVNGPDFGARSDKVAMLTGWVVVAEWMDSDGLKWLSMFNGNAGGETLTTWAMNGMLHEALHGEWPVSDPDDS